MEGLGLPVLGSDLRLLDGCQVGSHHRQQRASAVKQAETENVGPGRTRAEISESAVLQPGFGAFEV